MAISKKTKWLIAAVAVGIILIYAGAKGWAERKVREMIEQEAAAYGLRVEIGRVRIQPIGRRLSFKNLSIATKSRLQGAGIAGWDDLQVASEEILLTGIRYRREGDRKGLHLRSVTLRNPQVRIERSPEGLPTDALLPGKSEPPLFRSIGRMVIEGGAVEHLFRQEKGHAISKVEGISLEADDLELDSLAAHPERFAERFRLFTPKLSYEQPDRGLRWEADSGAWDGSARRLALQAVRLLPLYPKEQFAASVQGRGDWTQLTAGPLTVSGVTITMQESEPALHLDSLHIREMRVASYKNRQIPQPERIKPLFHQPFQRLPFAFGIGFLQLDHLRAEYEELPVEGNNAGKIFFEEVSAECTGLTNRAVPERAFYTLKTRGRLMGEGLLEADIYLPTDSLTNRFEARGHLGPFDLRTLNGILRPLAQAEIGGGTLQGMDFHIAGDIRSSRSELTLLYNGLSVTLLKEENGQLKTRQGATLLAGALIYSENPGLRGLRTGEGTFERNPYRSHFNYLWKSLWPGIKRSIQ